MIRKSNGRDGLIVFWDAAETDRVMFSSALESAGLGTYMPEAVDKGMAIKSVARDAVAHFGMRVHGSPAEAKGLLSESIGCDVIRVVKGADKNSYPHMFTVAVTHPDAVRVLHNDPTHGFSPSMQWLCPSTGLKHGVQAAEAYMTAQYRAQLRRLPGVTAGAISRKAVVHGMDGVPLSRTGKAYFLPGKYIGAYETLALAVNQHDSGGMQYGWFAHEIEPSSHSFDQLCEAVRAEAQQIVSVADEDLANCSAAGRKIRSDARDNRIADINAGLEKMESYERMLGVTFDDIREAMERVRGALAMQSLIAASA